MPQKPSETLGVCFFLGKAEIVSTWVMLLSYWGVANPGRGHKQNEFWEMPLGNCYNLESPVLVLETATPGFMEA